MEAVFYQENSYALVLRTESNYIVIQKNHFDDDMGSLGLIIRYEEPLLLSLHKNDRKLFIYWSSGEVHERNVLHVSNNEIEALSVMDSIRNF